MLANVNASLEISRYLEKSSRYVTRKENSMTEKQSVQTKANSLKVKVRANMVIKSIVVLALAFLAAGSITNAPSHL